MEEAGELKDGIFSEGSWNWENMYMWYQKHSQSLGDKARMPNLHKILFPEEGYVQIRAPLRQIW